MSRRLLYGAIPVFAIAASLIFSTSQKSSGQYDLRLSSHLKSDNTTIDKTFEYYHMLQGDFTMEDRERARNLAQSVNRDRSSFNWVDQGPDNVGGRTRGIVVDRNSINHLYAGSVSGGLFDLYDVENRREVLEGLQVMESAALREFSKKADG